MDYGLLYNCPFVSLGGHNFIIKIYKKNYDGATIKRSLGGSPSLRQDKNGSICGSSLEFKLEAIVNDEFHSLYTSDAREYKVELISDGSVAWVGFISPELYSEPDIAPPFDVSVTATDGLGELKNYDFDVENADVSIRRHLQNCLALTGLENMHIVALSTISDNNGDMSVREFFSQKIDLSFLEGKTYYDVLTMILDSINATIRMSGYNWLILRETDMSVNAYGYITPTGYYIDDNTTGEFSIYTGTIGRMGLQDIYPIGYLTNEVSPACNKVTVTSDNHYKSLLTNPNMESDYNWIKSVGVTFDTDHYVLPTNGGMIRQVISMDGGYPYMLLLSVDARCKYNSQHDEDQKIAISIQLKTQAGTIYYYNPSPSTTHSHVEYINSKHNRANRVLNGNWLTGSQYWDYQYLSPAVNDNEDDLQTLEYRLEIPKAIPGRGSLEPIEAIVYIKNVGTYYEEMIYRAELMTYYRNQGTKTIIKLNNSARETAGDLELLIPFNNSTSRNSAKLLMGIPVSPDYGISTKWMTSKFGNKEYNELLAYDYAQSRALPRWKKKGKINIPDTSVGIHTVYVFDSNYTNRDPYIIQTYSWDLNNDEADVEMISLPTGTITGTVTGTVTTASIDANGDRGAILENGSFEAVGSDDIIDDTTDESIDDASKA